LLPFASQKATTAHPQIIRKLSAKKVVTKRLAAVSWFYQPLLIRHDRLFIEHQGAHHVRF
jgi:hypothetical protein